MTRTHLLGAVVIGACSLVAGCALNAPVADDSAVTVFGPYRDGDAAAFADVIERFTQETGIPVRYTGTGSLVGDLAERVDEGDLPDVAIVPQPSVVEALVENDLLVPLGAGAAAAVEANYRPDAIELMTYRDVLHAVLYRVSVKSLVWYPPGVFAELGYAVPRRWEELVSLTEQMERDGFEPWCFTLESFASTGWVGTDWIEDIVLRLYGIETYQAWVEGNVEFTDPSVREAFEVFGGIVRTPGRVNGGIRRALSVNWAEAGDPMFTDPPGCLLHRQASFYESQLPRSTRFGDEVDVFLLPGIDADQAPLLASGDLVVGFEDRPEVQELMAFLATPEAGEPWAGRGGYTSPHATFELSAYANDFDRMIGGLITAADTLAFDGSDQMPPGVGTGSFWDGVVDYVRTGDLDGVLTRIQAGWESTGGG